VISNWTGRPVCDRPGSDLRSGNHIADLDLDQVTTAKLAVDCQIEQCSVPNASLSIKKEADGPDLLLGERALGADLLSGIPSCTLADSSIELRIANMSSPRP
jgi:hypothetical protein